ncbi:hypothetical protein VTJ04DRAFT_9638 [Mycothermus thermophilus]|uniref:uncharacterized protein n=1 Tax=Humicola insolens TaxID=85995 RepID=UPI0037440EB9
MTPREPSYLAFLHLAQSVNPPFLPLLLLLPVCLAPLPQQHGTQDIAVSQQQQQPASKTSDTATANNLNRKK